MHERVSDAIADVDRRIAARNAADAGESGRWAIKAVGQSVFVDRESGQLVADVRATRWHLWEDAEQYRTTHGLSDALVVELPRLGRVGLSFYGSDPRQGNDDALTGVAVDTLADALDGLGQHAFIGDNFHPNLIPGIKSCPWYSIHPVDDYRPESVIEAGRNPFFDLATATRRDRACRESDSAATAESIHLAGMAYGVNAANEARLAATRKH